MNRDTNVATVKPCSATATIVRKAKPAMNSSATAEHEQAGHAEVRGRARLGAARARTVARWPRVTSRRIASSPNTKPPTWAK